MWCPSSKDNSDRIGFLDLPCEIRDLIYELAFHVPGHIAIGEAVNEYSVPGIARWTFHLVILVTHTFRKILAAWISTAPLAIQGSNSAQMKSLATMMTGSSCSVQIQVRKR
jgi:hypothetical protein